MADPVIVPPTPTINQNQVVDTSPGLEALQKAFDKVLPEIKHQPTQPKEPASEPVTQPKEIPDKTPPPVTEPAKEPAKESHDVPSFLEQALRGAASQAPSKPAEEEWPEEVPEFKTPEERTTRYKKWRTEYNNLKSELKTLREKPSLNAQQVARMEMLEGHNRQMTEMLTRLGVEHSVEFQNSIMRPLYQNWNEAVKIVKQAGGDPQRLAKAMTLNGREQFEALDELFGELPESAKSEANEALRNYRRFDDARKSAIQNAPQAFEGIRKRELERQYAEVNRQRDQMKNIFDRALDKLKNEAKLEIYQKSDLPDAQWWNEQGETLAQQSRDLYLENSDLEKVAFACLLAPAADVYRKLWFASQKKIGEMQKLINDRLGGEPTLSEQGGPGGTLSPGEQLASDLKQPFEKVFLREFHRSQARSR